MVRDPEVMTGPPLAKRGSRLSLMAVRRSRCWPAAMAFTTNSPLLSLAVMLSDALANRFGQRFVFPYALPDRRLSI